MTRLTAVLFVASSVWLDAAASAQVFTPPSEGPLVQTANYTSLSNSTLKDKPTCKGKAFNRMNQIWLENTDFAWLGDRDAQMTASTPIFESLAEQGILLTNYNAITHPSEPNSIGGDFFGMHDDNMYHIPSNISTVVDLLEDKHVSWATYQENVPADDYLAPNYMLPTSKPYPYYVRKHNPLVIYDAISQDQQRVKRIRTFNDFANDVVNDAHDTTIDFAASCLEYWLLPLLTDPRVNDDETLILLTFDETEMYTIQNNVFAVALGGAIPLKLRGTTDDTITVSNVLSFVAAKTGYRNVDVLASGMPEFKVLTGVVSGALTSALFTPFAAPNLKAKGASGGPVLLRPGLNTKLTPTPAAARGHDGAG
ncbi:hypothetical protein B0H13DRAFT_2227408 [Mycena leptocephala]|nr:hypothetical protein B0H13DRAFT_2227408 [Mycena leptocephala]